MDFDLLCIIMIILVIIIFAFILKCFMKVIRTTESDGKRKLFKILKVILFIVVIILIIGISVISNKYSDKINHEEISITEITVEKCDYFRSKHGTYFTLIWDTDGHLWEFSQEEALSLNVGDTVTIKPNRYDYDGVVYATIVTEE